jgi:hypothetical protein
MNAVSEHRLTLAVDNFQEHPLTMWLSLSLGTPVDTVVVAKFLLHQDGRCFIEITCLLLFVTLSFMMAMT